MKRLSDEAYNMSVDKARAPALHLSACTLAFNVLRAHISGAFYMFFTRNLFPTLVRAFYPFPNGGVLMMDVQSFFPSFCKVWLAGHAANACPISSLSLLAVPARPSFW